MSFKNLLSACLLASLTSISLSVNAANINVNVARQTASDFLKVHAVTTPGSFKAPSMNDLRLAFTESSSVDHNANAYYAFNINGGGFIKFNGQKTNIQNTNTMAIWISTTCLITSRRC